MSETKFAVKKLNVNSGAFYAKCDKECQKLQVAETTLFSRV